jgi:hypothetical protein
MGRNRESSDDEWSDGTYVHKDDGTYIRGNDGRDYHISSNPEAKGDDGSGRDSDGGNSD